MASVCSVALLTQIPYVRVYIAAVIFKLSISCKEAALGVNSSAAENICYEVSGVALGLKRVIIGIDTSMPCNPTVVRSEKASS